MKNVRFCQVLLTKAKERGVDHVRSCPVRGPWPSGFSLLVSPGVGPLPVWDLLVWGRSWCGDSPGVGSPGMGPPGVMSPNVVSPNVVNYNDGASNVKSR